MDDKKKHKRQYNEQNLAKGVKFSKENQPSPEAKKRGRAKKKQERKILETAAEILLRNLAKESVDDNGEVKTIKEIGLNKVLLNYANGDKWAVELVLKLIGELTEKVEATNTNINITDEKVINNVIDKIKDL